MITTHADEQGFEAVLTAQFTEIDVVCQAVQVFLDRQDLQHISFAILLGIREALTNAIQHGSGLDPEKEIRFSLARRGDTLTLMTVDQGPGFNWRQAAKVEAENLSESGRGISILYHYFEEVQFNEAGNELFLFKELTGKAGATKLRTGHDPAITTEERSVMSEIQKDAETVTIKPGCDIVASMLDGLKAELKELAGSGCARLVIDFTEVRMIDSMGIGLLIAAYNSLKQKGAALELLHVSEEITTLFKHMRLNQHFTIS